MTAGARRVAVGAVGTTQFLRQDCAVADVLADAARVLLADNPRVDRGMIDAVVVSTNDDAKYLGAITSQAAGIRPRASHTVESMCSSGTNAIVTAYSYVASGLARAVLVVGADSMRGPGHVLEWDRSRGELGHPVYWASIVASAYRRRSGARVEDVASIAAKNRTNAADNPDAVCGGRCTIDDVMESRRITDDLRLLECCMPATGGAAMLVTAEDLAGQVTDTPVWIAGIGQQTEGAGFARTADFASMQSTSQAARRAFAMAGAAPQDVDVAEVHDAFAVCEAQAVEDVGMAGVGSGAAFCRGLYDTDSRRVNPRGGLIGSGHPPGATGVAQAVEVVRQLRGDAGKRQADSPEVGMVHNMSAAATSSTVLVMSL